MGTKISGVAAAENIDSSGEILSIEGLDISSIHDGTAFLNYEHQNTTPTNGSVGKILFGKKIFSEKDCDTEDQLKWWKHAQVPFLYIIGELFDEEGHSAAIDIAAMARYDEKLRKQNMLSKDGLKPVVNFSVEGAKLKSEGNRITRSIARKVSVTVLACNKICWASIYNEPAKTDQPSTEQTKPMAFNEIKKQIMEKKMHKTEEVFADLSKNEKIAQFKMGTTTSGKPISPKHTGSYDGWDHKDHQDAANAHYGAFEKTKDPQTKMMHMRKVNFHMRMGGKLENRARKVQETATGFKKNQNPLEKEQLVSKMFKNENFAIPVWKKVQQFRSWVSTQAPGLSHEEVEALTRLMANAKWSKAESALKNI